MAMAEIEGLMRDGIAAARAGQAARARELLLQVIARDEEVEAAWLWLSGVVDDPAERRVCLENVLALNPANTAARSGLRWLDEQAAAAPPADRPAAAEPPPAPPVLDVEIDPFGCPFCGGSLAVDSPLCPHCARSVLIRSRRPAAGSGLPWLVGLFLVVGAAAWLEGYAVAQTGGLGRFAPFLSQTAARYLFGAALFRPDGLPGELHAFAGVVTLSDNILAGLCVAAALGLALRSRAVYLASFLLAGLLVVVTGAGLLAGLVGWLASIVRLGLVALCLRWLVDGARAFEWDTRSYDADLDLDLRTDMDYYSAGHRYAEMGMWAKAAAHWKVAGQLAPGQAQHRVALANAYVRLGYPHAARAALEKALARTPDDEGLRAFYESLAAVSAAGGEA